MNDRYISDNLCQKFRAENVAKIFAFGEVRKAIREWYANLYDYLEKENLLSEDIIIEQT